VLATRTILIAVLLWPAAAWAGLRAERAPDQVRMNDGTELRGLILQNTSEMVVLETENGEARLPKEYIRRIDDAPNGEQIVADIVGKDELPSWRSIVHDLRTHDSVRVFEQIPPTAIDSGLLRNIPYLSFRANEKWEMNVYGNPDKPVAIEFGLYGAAGPDKETRRTFHEFIAGHLHSREQIAALYSLGPNKRAARAGKLAFRLILPADPDGYGGTWFVVYRPDTLASARLTDKAYAAITRPFEQVNNRDGSLRADKKDENINWLERMVEMMTGKDPEMRGFYRDKNGMFRVLTGDS
jgi:RNase P/RNase MRP subunit p29